MNEWGHFHGIGRNARLIAFRQHLQQVTFNKHAGISERYPVLSSKQLHCTCEAYKVCMK